jgi:hypothetical protein
MRNHPEIINICHITIVKKTYIYNLNPHVMLRYCNFFGVQTRGINKLKSYILIRCNSIQIKVWVPCLELTLYEDFI